MARVTGPLFSLAAHGTYRRALVFRTTAAGTHVGVPPLVTATRSLAQTQTAQKVADLNAAWSALPPATKSAWGVCGATFSLSGHRLWWREWFLQGSTPGNPPVSPCP